MGNAFKSFKSSIPSEILYYKYKQMEEHCNLKLIPDEKTCMKTNLQSTWHKKYTHLNFFRSETYIKILNFSNSLHFIDDQRSL